MRRSRAVKWLIGLLFLGTVCGMISLLDSYERLLPSRSSVVAHADQFEQYTWQSDHAILLFRRLHEPFSPWSIEKVDLLTKQHVSYSALTKRFEQAHTSADSFATSPDGKWLLWSSQDFDSQGTNRSQATGWLANLETGYVEHFPVDSFASIEPNKLYWMADSERFVEVAFPGSTSFFTGRGPSGGPRIIRNVNTLQQTKELKVRLDWDLERNAEIRVISEEHLVAITSTFYDTSKNSARPPELVETTLIANASPTQRRPLTLPSGTKAVSEIVISPQGDRYAIAAMVDTHPAWLDVLRHWHIPVPISSHPQTGIWIFSLNGKKNREVIHMTPAPDSQLTSGSYEKPSHLRWSPDGKQLGFVFKGDLYRVPTE